MSNGFKKHLKYSVATAFIFGVVGVVFKMVVKKEQ